MDFLYDSVDLGSSWIIEELKNPHEEALKIDLSVEELDNKSFLNSPACEVDESLLSHLVEGEDMTSRQQWVLGIWDRSLKFAKVFIVPDRSAETLIPIINRNVRNDMGNSTRIYSDYWGAYNELHTEWY